MPKINPNELVKCVFCEQQFPRAVIYEHEDNCFENETERIDEIFDDIDDDVRDYNYE